MSSHAQDAATQSASSAGAQSSDTTLNTNAAQNQAFANQSRSTLFGTYNPATNQYSGGSESQFLNPSSLNTTNLTGSYANEYNNLANQTAAGAQQSVGTSMQNLASRGMGATPAGFAADQQRQAYQTQAAQNGANYANLFGQQHSEALNQYTNANSMLSNNSTGADQLSVSGNSAAAGNYSGLYGTASQQVANPWATAAGAVAGLGTAASGFMP